MMIQFNMATGEIISPESGGSYSEEQSIYDVASSHPQPELQLLPHEFESTGRKSMPADLLMADPALFIATQR